MWVFDENKPEKGLSIEDRPSPEPILKKLTRKNLDSFLESLDDDSKQYLSEKLLPSRIWLLAYGVAIGLSLGLMFFFGLEMLGV